MVNNALSLLEQGPYAPRCPHGHGPLTTVTDPDAPTGIGLACPTCGARRELETSMLRTLLNPETSTTRFDVPLAGRTRPEPAREDPTERIPVDELWKAPAPTTRDDLHQPLPSPRPTPRGLRPDGTIRTTGWLQLGHRTISSGLWAALTGLTLGLALIDLTSWLPLILTATGYATWHAQTRWIRPASTAVNLHRTTADRLTPGTAIRLHGPIGPVGIVDEITPVRRNRIRIDLDGGTHLTVPDTARCHVVDLRS
ncbi:hypothetical protein [Saccharopolyspora taberi]|uniref:Uncharacterized protein n=1 Tax=Saccharopolyspora taberi TaxID=60895 RepID=A0ABN3VDC4_9PSEU